MPILLVEDEPALAQFIKKGLESEGFTIEIASDGRAGLALLRQKLYSLAILDGNLPHISGFELCRNARDLHPQMPLMMLTAHDSLDDKIAGFEAGADDYLPKPFEFKELLMRIQALVRRSGDISARRILRLADLELDLDRKKVLRAGVAIDLTSREYALCEYLMVNRGKVISRSDIIEKVWDLNFDPGTNVIDVYISYLRKKIDKNFEPKLLHTVVGMGYVLREG
jgi:two-component system, OmpR family, copper resistance phosphate regulon response regulator CusR